MKATITIISGDEDNLRMASEAAEIYGYKGLYGVGEYEVGVDDEDAAASLCAAIYERGVDCTAMMHEGTADEMVYIPEIFEWAACR